jgi:hypothetical protein
MKISAYHKKRGDTVILNSLTDPHDISYGSWLFTQKYQTDIAGGPAVDPLIKLPPEIDDMPPDYDLYPIDYSIGYTWSYCPRKCEACVVPNQQNPKRHDSILKFHNARFSKICLLNNNTFSDPRWLDTFQEIWDLNLTVIEHGFDVRLLDNQKAEALLKTRFDKQIHFAWDYMKDERKIIKGLQLAKEYGLHRQSMVYVLTGFNSSFTEDLYRCQQIHDLGFDPFVMVYNTKKRGGQRQAKNFKRMVNNTRIYKKIIYQTDEHPNGDISKAWKDYR